MPDQKKNLAKELPVTHYGKKGAYIPQEGGIRLNMIQAHSFVDKSGNVVEQFRSVEDANRYMAEASALTVWMDHFKRLLKKGSSTRLVKELTGHEGERVSLGSIGRLSRAAERRWQRNSSWSARKPNLQKPRRLSED